MKFLCIANPPRGPSYFLEGSTYDGGYSGGDMINLIGPLGSDREGKMTTYGPEVRACMLEDPEQAEEVTND